jgi:hypothetical protein
LIDSLRRHELLRLSVSWPLTVKTENWEADGETRSFTGEGILPYCSESLREGILYSVTIKLPEKPFDVTGKLTWSNLGSSASSSFNPAMGFYFMRIDEGKDRQSLIEAIATQCEKSEPLRWQAVMPYRFTALW